MRFEKHIYVIAAGCLSLFKTKCDDQVRILRELANLESTVPVFVRHVPIMNEFISSVLLEHLDLLNYLDRLRGHINDFGLLGIGEGLKCDL